MSVYGFWMKLCPNQPKTTMMSGRCGKVIAELNKTLLWSASMTLRFEGCCEEFVCLWEFQVLA